MENDSQTFEEEQAHSKIKHNNTLFGNEPRFSIGPFILFKRNLRLIISISLFLTSAILVYSAIYDNHTNVPFLIIALLFFLFGLGIGVYWYLKPAQVNGIRFDFESISEGLSLDQETKLRLIVEDFFQSDDRIKKEIERLARSANVNLVFGALTTISGVVFLAMQIFDQKTSSDDWKLILAHYLPRISLVILIEVFAFFFLKIYKVNLSDIKFFSNERTNMEQKILSLKIAILAQDKKMIRVVIRELAKTERNFTLKKGETTIDIEKEKVDSSDIKGFIKGLQSLIKLK